MKGLGMLPEWVTLECLRLFGLEDSGQSSRDWKSDRNPSDKVQTLEVYAGMDCIGL